MASRGELMAQLGRVVDDPARMRVRGANGDSSSIRAEIPSLRRQKTLVAAKADQPAGRARDGAEFKQRGGRIASERQNFQCAFGQIVFCLAHRQFRAEMLDVATATGVGQG